MQTRLADMAPQTAARVAGVLYLVIIAGGLFAEAFVRDQLIVGGDAAATARNILDHALLYRLGFAVHLFYLACALALAVILYDMFRRVSSSLALLALCFDVVSIAIEAGNLLNQFAPLRLLTDAGLSGLDAGQLHAMAYAHVRLFASGFGLSLVFFGFFCLATGTLIYRSTFLPRALGVLMVVAGGCYLFNSFAVFLSPGLAARLFPWILLPCLIAESLLALWLTVKGIRVARFAVWFEHAHGR
jgi:hypothetical protein